MFSMQWPAKGGNKEDIKALFYGVKVWASQPKQLMTRQRYSKYDKRTRLGNEWLISDFLLDYCLDRVGLELHFGSTHLSLEERRLKAHRHSLHPLYMSKISENKQAKARKKKKRKKGREVKSKLELCGLQLFEVSICSTKL